MSAKMITKYGVLLFKLIHRRQFLQPDFVEILLRRPVRNDVGGVSVVVPAIPHKIEDFDFIGKLKESIDVIRGRKSIFHTSKMTFDELSRELTWLESWYPKYQRVTSILVVLQVSRCNKKFQAVTRRKRAYRHFR